MTRYLYTTVVEKLGESKRKMSKVYQVKAIVKRIKGNCTFGHKIGEEILFDGRSVKGDVCYGALAALFPKVYAMRYGVEWPIGKSKYIQQVACPDPENCVVFEISRCGIDKEFSRRSQVKIKKVKRN